MVLRFLTFWSGDTLYGLAADAVAEIVPMPGVARIPQGPREILGLAQLRGAVLPMVSLNRLLKPDSTDRSARAIILQKQPLTGLAVDRVEGIVSITHDVLKSAAAIATPEMREQLTGAFQTGDKRQTVRILDLDALLDRHLRPAARERSHTRSATAHNRAMQTPKTQFRQRFVTFHIAQQEFALPIEAVREIISMPSVLATMPKSEALVLGVINYREQLLPIMSARGLLGLPTSAATTDREKIVVATVGETFVGLLVDRTGIVLHADPSLVEPVPTLLAARIGGEAGVAALYREQDGRRLVSILNPQRLFRADVLDRLIRTTTAESDPVNSSSKSATASVAADNQFLIFTLADDEYALPITCVDEVATVPDQMSRLPKSPRFLEGVINLRGAVLPVIDQRRRFELPLNAGGDRRRLIVIKTDRFKAGIIVDSVLEVRRAALDAIEETPALAGDATDLVKGVLSVAGSRRMILILDPQELLSRSEQKRLADWQPEADSSRS